MLNELPESRSSLAARPKPGADLLKEYHALTRSAGLFDLSARSRLCLVGADRARFLHGQVTNDINRLRSGTGCYAALVSAKGKMESDLNVYVLEEEILLDFEPGLATKVQQRLEKYIVADDVQVVDAAPHYGLLSVQGPWAEAAINASQIASSLPEKPHEIMKFRNPDLGEVYIARLSRSGNTGFDLFIPGFALDAALQTLGRHVFKCSLDSLEIARIEAGIPRFSVDMTENNFPQECGIEDVAVSYRKGCYIGQEVLNRLHTMGHVNRQLRYLEFSTLPPRAPACGEKLLAGHREVGYLTSFAVPPESRRAVALGLVNRTIAFETELQIQSLDRSMAKLLPLPCSPQSPR